MTAKRIPAGLFVAAVFIASLLLLTSAHAAPGDFLYQWGSQQHLLDPEGVAVDSAGNVYVTDTDKVQVFDPAGIRIRQWGSYGAGEGQLKFPARLSVDATGRVYVADAGNARIEVFDTSGNFIGQWSYDGWATNPPLAVVSDGKGKVYVLESGMYDSTGFYFEGGVRVFDSEGNFLRDLGAIGSGPGQYSFAGGIALDAAGNVYVLDNGNSRVLEFNGSGAFVKIAVNLAGLYGRDMAIDSSGRFYIAGGFPFDDAVWIYSSAGTLLRKVRFVSEVYLFEHFWQPKTVAVDAKGNIYTLDLGNDGLRVFNNAGTPLSQWWSYGAGLGQMNRPTGIAVDSSGRVYETDAFDPVTALFNDRVQVFSATGTPIAKWTGPFCQTSGVTVDSSGNLQVLDTRADDVISCQPAALTYTFDPSGHLIGQWGDPFPNELNLSPFGIAQDTAGRFLVTDSTTATVRVYDTAGNYLRSFGSFGSGNGQFNNPKGIAVDAAGNIYVADSGNARVQVFNSSFTFVRKWGSSGFSNGFFRNPSGIAVDALGHVFVADTGNNRIQVFDRVGTFLKKWGGEGDENGQLHQPAGIALDRSGSKVYVADSGNNRIQVFEGFGAATTYSISGTVRRYNATGPVLAGATVALAGKSATTGSTGTFAITDVPAGTYSVTVSKAGYATKTITGFVVDANKSGVTFSLIPTYSVSGKVHKGSSTGPALSGATVAIGPKSTTTDASGAFTFPAIQAGSHTVTVSKSGYQTKTITGFYLSADKSGLNYYLTPVASYSMSGTIREGSTTGPPLAGATVSIAGKSATTSSTGSFGITGIPAGTYTLSISKTGYATKTITGFVMNSNKSVSQYLSVSR